MNTVTVDAAVETLLISRGRESYNLASIHHVAEHQTQPVSVTGNPGEARSLSLHARLAMIHNPQAL